MNRATHTTAPRTPAATSASKIQPQNEDCSAIPQSMNEGLRDTNAGASVGPMLRYRLAPERFQLLLLSAG